MNIFVRMICISLCAFYLCACVSTVAQSNTSDQQRHKLSFLSAVKYIEADSAVEAYELIDSSWVNQFSTLIQETSPGPLQAGPWGFSRVKENKIYYIIFNWQAGHFMQFPNTELPILEARCLNNGKAVKVKWATGVEIFIDEKDRDTVATVIELKLEGNAEKLHPVKVSDWTDSTLLAKDNSVRNWQNDRFGMFVHWGPCTVGEREISWSRNGSRLGRIRYGGSGVNGEYKEDLEYDILYKRFNPTSFDAEKWVKIAKDAGMRYIVLTTKHHDGFCLFDSKVTDYDIMSTPYGRDICKELADACHKNGLKLGWYYSPRDWFHKDFAGPRHQVYMDYEMKQLEELLTNYGKVDILWFDCLDSPQYLWNNFPEESFRKIRQWQPDILINDRGGLRGDYDTPEQELGAFERHRPWETCATLGTSWSWRGKDESKSFEMNLKLLINTASRDGNFLLNVSPQPNGTIPSKQLSCLSEIGHWLSKYGQSIYGTRGGPFLPKDEVTSTCKENTIYLHLTGQDRVVYLPEFDATIQAATLLNGGDVTYEKVYNVWKVVVRPKVDDEVAYVVKLTVDKRVEEMNVMNFQVLKE